MLVLLSAISSFQGASASEAPPSAAHFWCRRSNVSGLCDWQEQVEADGGDPLAAKMNFPDVKFVPNSTLTSNSVVDSSTIMNKVIMGYQGWFGSPDGDYGWRHWATNLTKPPAIGNTQFDIFPDLAEYPANTKYPTNLKTQSGSTIGLYGGMKEGVVDTHFKWMQQYGLDGVFPQRFMTEIKDANSKSTNHADTVLELVSKSAVSYGRTYAVMYDITNAPSGWETELKNDFTNKIQAYTTKQNYLHQNGKPVICIFGLGLNQNPQPSATDALALVNWFKQRAYLIGSGPFHWRLGGHDAISGYDKVHAAFDAIMPWSVGRYGSVTAFKSNYKNYIQGDAQLCKSRGQAYAPIAFPGYSFHNTNSAKPLNEIPRLGGTFLQAQIDDYLKLGSAASFFYVAMFDEINEGTAMYKVAATKSELPKDGTSNFVYMSMDGTNRPGDYMLSLGREYTANAKKPR